MRAVVCKEYGPPEKLVVEEVPDPKASGSQVVVDVKACGVSFPDLLMIQNLYQLKPPPPFTPGSEVAGVVAEVGDSVSSVKPGDRVVAMTGFAGFAEKVVVGEQSLMPLPEGMDFPVAAGFTMNYGTSHYALKDRARLQPGETLLVLGAAGGVGLTAVEIGKLMGARVVAAASTADKLELCREYGADEVIDYTEEDLKQRAKALGIDVVYDPVGGDFSEKALRALKPWGRHLVIGFAAGDIPSIPLNLPLIKEVSVVGVLWGGFIMREPDHNRRNLEELVGWYAEGKLRPHVSQTYPLEQAGQALRDMADRKVRGKAVLTTEHG